MKKKKLFVLLLILIFAMIALDSYVKNYFFSITPSLSYRVFKKSPHPYKKGDYVLVEVPFAVTEKKVFIKKIACVEGDYLKVEGRDFYCNGEFIGAAKDKTLTGEPLQYIYYDGMVPEGYVFVIGDCFDSYDSRYFGLVPKSFIKTKLEPVL